MSPYKILVPPPWGRGLGMVCWVERGLGWEVNSLALDRPVYCISNMILLLDQEAFQKLGLGVWWWLKGILEFRFGPTLGLGTWSLNQAEQQQTLWAVILLAKESISVVKVTTSYFLYSIGSLYFLIGPFLPCRGWPYIKLRVHLLNEEDDTKDQVKVVNRCH